MQLTAGLSKDSRSSSAGELVAWARRGAKGELPRPRRALLGAAQRPPLGAALLLALCMAIPSCAPRGLYNRCSGLGAGLRTTASLHAFAPLLLLSATPALLAISACPCSVPLLHALPMALGLTATSALRKHSPVVLLALGITGAMSSPRVRLTCGAGCAHYHLAPATLLSISLRCLALHALLRLLKRRIPCMLLCLATAAAVHTPRSCAFVPGLALPLAGEHLCRDPLQPADVPLQLHVGAECANHVACTHVRSHLLSPALQCRKDSLERAPAQLRIGVEGAGHTMRVHPPHHSFHPPAQGCKQGALKRNAQDRISLESVGHIICIHVRCHVLRPLPQHCQQRPDRPLPEPRKRDEDRSQVLCRHLRRQLLRLPLQQLQQRFARLLAQLGVGIEHLGHFVCTHARCDQLGPLAQGHQQRGSRLLAQHGVAVEHACYILCSHVGHYRLRPLPEPGLQVPSRFPAKLNIGTECAGHVWCTHLRHHRPGPLLQCHEQRLPGLVT
mmetsp:Transcript_100370/g.323956  ORF Transcript_100370/g.323956 Transcript_100370/m.323956 type:complete len:501 (-) Transcript_100370:771-2273(-)